ncbi:MAG: hypothetical protein IMZ53_05410 [Thermoplasmata archaeon]|nr:hypothetical protein [Thermoplasmata archaeon]
MKKEKTIRILTYSTTGGNPAFPTINEEQNRYEYEPTIDIDGVLVSIGGGKRRKENPA